MPEFLQILSALREQMNATLSRSDVLKPLAWMLLIIAMTMVAIGIYVQHLAWLIVAVAVLFLGTSVVYLFSYLYCLFYNPDALRSEKYSLQKMAIEHNLLGDNVTGMFEAKQESAQTLPPLEAATKQIENKR
jgi:membrane protein YdbS with pleckstrin-like domain